MVTKGELSILQHTGLLGIKRLLEEEDEDQLKNETAKSNISFRLAKYLLANKLVDIIDIINALCSFLLSCLYAADTYVTTPSQAQIFLEIIIVFILIVEFAIRFAISENKFFFALSFNSCLDYMTLIPILLVRFGAISGSFYEFFRVVRILCCLRLEKFFARKNLLVAMRIYRLLVTLLSLVMICGAAILEFENITIADKLEDIHKKIEEGIALTIEEEKTEKLTFHDMFYFMVVTLSTVGYGDIYPNNDISKFITIITLLLMLAMLPPQTQDIMKVVNLTSKYLRTSYIKSSPKAKHILLIGDARIEAVRTYLNELYHEDHGCTNVHTIIMKNYPPTEDELTLLRCPKFHGKVLYLQGNIMNYKDLKRAQADDATCGVILSKKHSKEPVMEDYRNILRAYALKEYASIVGNRELRICLQLVKPEHEEIFLVGINSLFSTDQVVCIEELKLQLIAKSCICPGIITIISSLITSTIPEIAPSDTGLEEKVWSINYLSGMQNELYRIPLKGEVFGGYSYMDVTIVMYSELKLILFALEVKVKGKRKVFVNPIDYEFGYDDHYGYVIHHQLPNADSINKLNLNRFVAHRKEKHQMTKEMKEPPIFRATGNFYSIFKKTRDEYNMEKQAKSNNYYMLQKPHDQRDASIYSATERRIENHVIVCGWVVGIEYLISSLRPRILGESRPPIIILANEVIPHKIWKKIHSYEEVYFIKGSPLNPRDLERASIGRAQAVVILSNQSDLEDENSSQNTHEAEAIFIYKTIKNMNARALIITELGQLSTISFLLSSKSEYISKYGYIVSEPFAAGEIYIPSLLDTLMCQAFYNPYITQIMTQMINGSATTSNKRRKMYKKHQLDQSALFLYTMPKELSKETAFSKVFEKCVSQYRMVPIGIYKNDENNAKPYVILNPREEEKVTQRDRLFVLYHSNPNEENLQFDNFLKSKPKRIDPVPHEKVAMSKFKDEEGLIDDQNAKQLRQINKQMSLLKISLEKLSSSISNKDVQLEDSLKEHVETLIRNKLVVKDESPPDSFEEKKI